MKTLLLALLTLAPLLTSADPIGYEIPFEKSDTLLGNDSYDHQSTHLKRITCYDRPVAIVYKMILGYSQGSRLVAVCALEKATSVESCVADDSPLARACYDYTVAFYKIRRTRPSASDFDRLAPARSVVSEDPAAAR